MLRYFTREDSEFIRENGELVHERVRLIHSDGENVIVDDDGETHVIPIEYINDTMDLFNTPYYTGHNLDKRLQLDYNINSYDTQTPFSAFSRRPLEIGSNHFFNTIFSKDQMYDDDDYDDDYDDDDNDDDDDEYMVLSKKRENKKRTKKRIRSGRKLLTKQNKSRKIKN